MTTRRTRPSPALRRPSTTSGRPTRARRHRAPAILAFDDPAADEAETLAPPDGGEPEVAEDTRGAWGAWALLLVAVSLAAVAGGWLLLRWGTPAPRSAVTVEAPLPDSTGGGSPATRDSAQPPPADAPSAAAVPGAPAAVAPPSPAPERNPPPATTTPTRRATPSATPPPSARAADPARPTSTARPAAPAPRPSPQRPRAATPATAAPAGAAGRVLVRTTPGGAEVFVNDERRGVTPLALRDLPFGAYTVRVVRAGYRPVEQRVAIDAGRPARSLEIALARVGTATSTASPAATPPAQTPAAAPGSLLVESRPAGARVFVDGVEIGMTPVTVPRLAIGAHSVRIERPGYRPITTTARVEAGERTRVAVTLTAERPR